MEIRVWNFKITGIAGIHAIPMILKSLHSDFPVESLQFPADICSAPDLSQDKKKITVAKAEQILK